MSLTNITLPLVINYNLALSHDVQKRQQRSATEEQESKIPRITSGINGNFHHLSTKFGISPGYFGPKPTTEKGIEKNNEVKNTKRRTTKSQYDRDLTTSIFSSEASDFFALDLNLFVIDSTAVVT